jgi:uncharacterized protein YceK
VNKSLLVVGAVWALSASGCGSVANVIDGDLSPYGGVRQDIAWIKSTTPNLFNGVPDPAVPRKRPTLGPAALIVDPIELSLSAVCDTLMLPLTCSIHPDGLHDLFFPDDWGQDGLEAPATASK